MHPVTFNMLTRFKPRCRRRVRGSSIPRQPDNLENRSIFFDNLRPLALLCKLFGTFNLEILPPTPKTSRFKHHWFSVDILWGIFLYVFSAFLQYTYETQKWWKILMPPFYARVGMYFVMCVVYDRHLPGLIQTIDQYDFKYRKCLVFHRKMAVHPGYKSYLGKVWALATSTCIIFLTMAIMFSKPTNAFTWFQLCISFFTIVTGLQRHLCISMFSFFCYYLTRCFREVQMEWKVCMEATLVRHDQWSCLIDAQPTETPEERLEWIRLLHSTLTSATGQLSACYGARLALYFVWFFIEYLLDLYELIYIAPFRSNSQIFFTIFHLVLITFAVTLAGNLTNTGADMGLELTTAPLNLLSEQCQAQVQAFFSQLMVAKLDIDAAGFCVVNRGILVSLLMSVTTYFIVILQFAPELTSFTNSFKIEYNETSP